MTHPQAVVEAVARALLDNFDAESDQPPRRWPDVGDVAREAFMAEAIALLDQIAPMQQAAAETRLHNMHRRAQAAEGLLERMARFLNTLELWAARKDNHWLRVYVRAAARHVRGQTGVANGLAWIVDRYERDEMMAELQAAYAREQQAVEALQDIAANGDWWAVQRAKVALAAAIRARGMK